MKKTFSILLVVLVPVLTLLLFACDVAKETTTTITTTTTTTTVSAVCNHSDISKLEVLKSKAPTCQEKGLTTGYICTVCGETVQPKKHCQ